MSRFPLSTLLHDPFTTHIALEVHIFRDTSILPFLLYFESLTVTLAFYFVQQCYFNKALDLENRFFKRYSNVVLVPRSRAPFGQRQEKINKTQR